jgi:hypothetical protein
MERMGGQTGERKGLTGLNLGRLLSENCADNRLIIFISCPFLDLLQYFEFCDYV